METGSSSDSEHSIAHLREDAEDATAPRDVDTSIDSEILRYTDPDINQELEDSPEEKQEDSIEESKQESSVDSSNIALTSSVPVNMSGTTKELNLGSLGKIEVLEPDKAQESSVSGTLHFMKDRDALDSRKLNELFYHAASRDKQLNMRYDLVTVAVDDPEALKNTYDLGRMLQASKDRLTTYDMLEPFNILIPDKDDPEDMSKMETKNLFTMHSEITMKQVAASNKFYATRLKPPVAEWLRQNLQVSQQYFENNSSTAMVAKVLERSNQFDKAEQGGPLFFKIMIDHLLITSRDAVSTLLKAVKKMDISRIPGEDVSQAVSLITGAYNYLKNLEEINHKAAALPSDFVVDVMKVFQTTSDAEFNELFTSMKATETMRRHQDPNHNTPVADVLGLAASAYADRVTTGTWDGVQAKKQETSAGFNLRVDGSGKLKPACHNCGDPNHLAGDCPKPKDEKRIEANRKARNEWFKKNRSSGKQGKSSNSKWAPPTAAEKQNGNKRVVDGKEMFYHKGRKRWIPDKFANQASVAQPQQAATAPAPASVACLLYTSPSPRD